MPDSQKKTRRLPGTCQGFPTGPSAPAPRDKTPFYVFHPAPRFHFKPRQCACGRGLHGNTEGEGLLELFLHPPDEARHIRAVDVRLDSDQQFRQRLRARHLHLVLGDLAKRSQEVFDRTGINVHPSDHEHVIDAPRNAAFEDGIVPPADACCRFQLAVVGRCDPWPVR